MNVETHIGQYKILRTLGAGGMGTVYLGEHILLGRRAAIKTLLPTLSSHREIVDRFFNEARAISAISDPGVVQIFDFGYHVDGTAYIVMEFLEGESLQARIERLGKLPLPAALRIARQIAGSLSAAHHRDIVHRDLKPGNVFLIRDAEAQGGERTKILDFGIAKLGDAGDASSTQTGTMLGTPVYMSPEQCRGAGNIDHRSDIYSVGCALFHMLTGRPPFEFESVGDFIAAHLAEPAPPPSSIAPELPASIDTLVLHCLEKSPDARYQSMTELQLAIERALADIGDQNAPAAPEPQAAMTPLGEGFKSAYDINRDTFTPTVDVKPPPPSHPWFVDSLAAVPASSISDDWPVDRPGVGFWRIVTLVLALFTGAAAGLVITGYVMDERQDAASPPMPAIAVVEEPALPDTRAASEPAPPPEDPAAKLTRDAPPVATKVQRPPRPHVKARPRPRRVVPPREAPEEDLYDTR